MLTNRRRFLCTCGAAIAGWLTNPGSAQAAPWAADCDAAAKPLPAAAQALLQRALDGLAPDQLWDMHCHLLGNGDSGSGCRLHPSLTEGWNLKERVRSRVFLDAACVPRDAPSVDRAYVQRLLSLVAGFPAGARWLLFAFDQAHDSQGRAEPDRSTFFVPNRYAQELAAAHPQRLEWVASIHPYRPDALMALDEAALGGARAVKWLPSAMNIDVRETRSMRFAERAAQHKLPLIVHCGEEMAVPGAGQDDLGNPLHVRALLERGATVVVAHCGSLGHAADLDRRSAPTVSAFELFARLMEEGAHGPRLMGDISAVFQANREPVVWQALLRNSHWHDRLLHGSDYPLPGLLPLTRLGKLQSAGLLQEADVKALEMLREHNPLLFDLALKRTVRLGTARLGDTIFATRSRFFAA
jgi:uncharacterized protein